MGTPAIADLNNDGSFEIIISSKDQYLYILNHQAELVTSYNANQYLLGTLPLVILIQMMI